MNLGIVREKADSVRGCLFDKRTTGTRRRHSDDEDPLAVMNLFVSDEAKIKAGKAFRVLNGKTQVFTSPQNPLIRNRQTHVIEVSAVSVIASELLGLNTDLVRAASYGHDIGHVPCGHQGEMWMQNAMGRPEFCHEVMGVVIAQKIERHGKGLNLCWHTLDAMMRHGGERMNEGMSQEALLLRFTDKFTYLFHDVNDIIVRVHYPVSKELLDLVDAFGKNQRERTTTAIAGLVVESAECGRVSFAESDLGKKFKRLKSLMYEVYIKVTQQDVEAVMRPALNFLEMIKVGDPFLLLALMTDDDVKALAAERMPNIHFFNQLGISEIVPHLGEIGTVDLCDPDLDW